MTAVTAFSSGVAVYPSGFCRMLDEIEEVVGERVFITEADRTKLTYNAQITKETLRHYTTIAMITRYIMKETYVDGFRIPKGTEIAVCSMVPVP